MNIVKPSKNELEELRKKAVDSLNSEPVEVEKYTYSYAELHEKKDEVQEFLIPDLIPDSEMCVLIGVDGVGKTQITSQLCFAIGTKRTNFLSLNLNVKHGNSIIAATEDSVKKFTQAIVKIGYGMDPKHKPAEVGLRFIEASNFADLPAFINEIESQLKIQKADLVVVDAFQDLLLLIDGEVNSNSHANQVMAPFQKLCKTYGCAILFIHHASKSSANAKAKEGKMFLIKNDSQGAGRITQKPRTVLGLTHDFASSAIEDSNTYTNYLHLLKTNLASRHFMKNAISLTFDQKTLLHESNGLVNIEQYENADKTATDFTPTKKPMAKEITIEQHKEKVNAAFEHNETLNRKDLVAQLRGLYGVGGNKIEEAGGYLSYLTDCGLIVGSVGVFRKGSVEEFKMQPSTANWETPPMEKNLDKNIIIKPTPLGFNTEQDDYDAPF